MHLAMSLSYIFSVYKNVTWEDDERLLARAVGLDHCYGATLMDSSTQTEEVCFSPEDATKLIVRYNQLVQSFICLFKCQFVVVSHCQPAHIVKILL